MKVATRLVPTSLSVEPGAETSCQTMVHNTGTVVDEYTFEVTGQAAPWAGVEPPKLSLFPGAQGAVRIRFRPPRVSTTPAGPLPFQVRTTSTTDHSVSTVEAGVLEVGAFTDLSAELTPHSSHGRRSGSHELRVRNGGNVPTPVQLSGKDPDAYLRFHLQPEALTIEPGAGGEAHVRAEPHHLRWLGRPQPHPFQVVATPQRGVPLTRDGIMRHDPVIPAWVPPLLALVVAAVVALILLLPKAKSPTVARVDPALAVGSVGQVTISGSNFAAKPTLPKVALVPPDGITAKVTEASPSGLVVAITVDSTAPVLDRDVTVTNATGASGTCGGCLKVKPPPAQRPTLTSVVPAQLPQGVSRQQLTITGTNFVVSPPPTVSFNPSGVTSVISSVTATQIALTVSIDASAPPGDRGVTVTNGDGGTASCLCFAIPPPAPPPPTPGGGGGGPPPPVVPNVVGQTLTAATGRLQSAGFQVQQVWEITGSLPRGAVIRTEPAANTPAAKGSTVAMHLALGKIAFATGGGISAIDPTGGIPTKLTQAQDSQPAWSPDGKRIAFIRHISGAAATAGSKDHVMVMNADGRSQQDVDPGGATIDADPAWSPDGTTIAFTRRTLNASNALSSSQLLLLTVAKPGSNPVSMLGPTPFLDSQPAWSPDGTRIAFTRKSGTANSQIFTIARKNGSSPAQVLAGGTSADSQPAWSPDSKKLAFTRVNANAKHEVWLMDSADGAEQQDLSSGNGNPIYNDDSPVWSLDGTRIAFDSDRVAPAFGLFTMDTHGGPAVGLVPNTTSPTW